MKFYNALFSLLFLFSCTENTLELNSNAQVTNVSVLDFQKKLTDKDHLIITSYSRQLFLNDFKDHEYHEISNFFEKNYRMKLPLIEKFRESKVAIKQSLSDPKLAAERLNFYSETSRKIINDIRDVLSNAKDESTFIDAILKSKKLVEESEITNKEEKALILTSLINIEKSLQLIWRVH